MDPPPTGVVPPALGGVDAVDPSRGPRARLARFRPRPVALGAGGVRPPGGGTTGLRPAHVVPPRDVGILFGEGQPTGLAGRSGDSAPLVGGSVPSRPQEPQGGGPSGATPGSSGVLDVSLMTAIAQVVRDEVSKSLEKLTPPTGGRDSRWSERRGSRTTPRRTLDYDVQATSSEDAGGESPSPTSNRGRDHLSPRRLVPTKIVVNNPLYQDVFDCETYGLANKSLRYTRSQARTLGRLKKDVAQSFGVRTEWDGTPPLKVFQFLRKFAKACDDNDVSEAEAFYMLQDFTKEPLRSEVMNVMPSRHGGSPGEVASYLELVNWLIRMHADEATLALQVEEFNRATQSAGEDERTFAERLRQLNVLCGFVHPQGVVKGRFVEGVHRAARATVRERNTPAMTLAELARIAQTKGDEYRWIMLEQRKEREKEAKKAAEATRPRRLPRALPYPRPQLHVGVAESSEEVEEVAAATTLAPSPKYGTRGPTSDRPCWQCGEVGHWAAQCPKLDARLRALLARSMTPGVPRTSRAPRPAPTRAVAMAQPELVEAELPPGEGEESTSAPVESSTSSSEPETGNE